MGTKTKPEYPTSTNPTIAELNALIYKTFPPKWNASGWWGYGKLYYYGDQLISLRVIGDEKFIDPHWMLDGMTPVGPRCVLGILEREGLNVDKFGAFFDELFADREAARIRCDELRQSAAAKLNDEERMACGLS